MLADGGQVPSSPPGTKQMPARSSGRATGSRSWRRQSSSRCKAGGPGPRRCPHLLADGRRVHGGGEHHGDQRVLVRVPARCPASWPMAWRNRPGPGSGPRRRPGGTGRPQRPGRRAGRGAAAGSHGRRRGRPAARTGPTAGAWPRAPRSRRPRRWPPIVPAPGPTARPRPGGRGPRRRSGPRRRAGRGRCPAAAARPRRSARPPGPRPRGWGRGPGRRTRHAELVAVNGSRVCTSVKYSPPSCCSSAAAGWYRGLVTGRPRSTAGPGGCSRPARPGSRRRSSRG